MYETFDMFIKIYQWLYLFQRHAECRKPTQRFLRWYYDIQKDRQTNDRPRPVGKALCLFARNAPTAKEAREHIYARLPGLAPRLYIFGWCLYCR